MWCSCYINYSTDSFQLIFLTETGVCFSSPVGADCPDVILMFNIIQLQETKQL